MQIALHIISAAIELVGGINNCNLQNLVFTFDKPEILQRSGFHLFFN